MFQLQKMDLVGFRSFEHAELSLHPLNWLVGGNGAGKSNLLALFSLLYDASSGRLQTHVSAQGGAERLLHYGAKQTPELTIRLTFAEGAEERRYEVRLAATAADQLSVAAEVLGTPNLVSLGGGHRELFIAGFDSAAAVGDLDGQAWQIADTMPGLPFSKVDQMKAALPELVRAAFRADSVMEMLFTSEALRAGSPSAVVLPLVRAADHICRQVRSWRVYHFNDTSPNAAVRKTASLGDNRFLRQDGSNLPAFLYMLRHKHAAAFGQIRDVVRRIAPYFSDFDLEPEALNPDRILLKWREKHSDQSFTVADLSDGTLRFVCLATLLLQPSPPPLILLDEPELGLHPAAVTLLSDMLHMAAQDTQLLVASQSVELLGDETDPSSVLVADRDPDGKTLVQRLDKAALADWLEVYSLGELWKKRVPGFGGHP